MRVDQHDRPHRPPPAPHADRPRPTTPPPNNPPPPAFTTIPLQLVAKLRKDVESREQELAAFQEKYKIRLIPESDMSTELGEYTYQGAYTTQAAIDTKRDVLVRTLAAFGKLYRFVHDPASKDAFLKARKTAVPTASNEENEALWRFIQRTKPFAANLVLTPERLDYMQKLNVELGVQQKALPFEQVADMSLARDAVKLLGGDI